MEAFTPSGLTINESLERAKESLRKYRQRENAALEEARSKKKFECKHCKAIKTLLSDR